jgi:CBS domain-containing protein
MYLRMNVKQIMTRNVECVEPRTPIAKAAEKMRDLDIGFLAICENDRLVGTVTDRDITIRSVVPGLDARTTDVRQVMTQSVSYCYEDDDIEQVGKEMQQKEVRRMLILNRDKRLVGVVSLGDIAKVLGEKTLAGQTLGEIADAA